MHTILCPECHAPTAQAILCEVQSKVLCFSFAQFNLIMKFFDNLFHLEFISPVSGSVFDTFLIDRPPKVMANCPLLGPQLERSSFQHHSQHNFIIRDVTLLHILPVSIQLFEFQFLQRHPSTDPLAQASE